MAPDLITLAILGVGGFVILKSGILSSIGSGGSTTSTDTGAGVGSPPPTADPGTGTTPPTTTPPTTTPPPTTGGGSNTCHSVYNGTCNVECQNGATAQCQACLIACGQGSLPPTGSYPPPPVTIPPQPQYPPQQPYPYPYPPTPVPIPTTDPNRCHNVYNGSCHTECSSGGDCAGCRAACGPNSGYARVAGTSSYYAAVQNSYRRQKINAYYAEARIPPIAIA